MGEFRRCFEKDYFLSMKNYFIFSLFAAAALTGLMIECFIYSSRVSYDSSSDYVEKPLDVNLKEVNITKIKLCNLNGLFSPILSSVYNGLRELGFPVEVVGEAKTGQRYDLEDTESIFITTLANEGGNFPKRYIAYNWEQLSAHELLHPDGLNLVLDNYRNAIEVWDYSEENVKMFQRFGINAKVILPGFDPLWVDQTLWTRGFKDLKYTSSFFGQYRDKRIAILDGLQKDIPEVFKVLGTPEAFNAKVVVNIHIFPVGSVLEIHRIMQVVSQKTLVLTERSDDKSLDELYAPMVTFFSSIDDLKDKIYQVGNMSEIAYGKLVMKRYNYLLKLPRFAENFKAIDSKLWNA